MKKTLKYIAILFGIILILIAGLLVFLQTNAFKDFLRQKVTQTINPKLNGQLSIGNIGGNFYNSIYLNNVALTDDADSVIANIDSLYIKYRIRSFSKKHIEVDTLHIEALKFDLWQKDSSTMQLLYVIEQFLNKSDTTKSEFPVILDFKYINICHSSGKYQFKYNTQATQFDTVNIVAKCFFKEKHVDVNLQKTAISIANPAINLQQIAVNYKKRGPLMEADSILIVSDGSSISGDAKLSNINNYEVHLNAKPLSGKELSFITDGLKTIEHVHADIQSTNDTVNLNLNLTNHQKTIKADATIRALIKALKQKGNKAPFTANIQIANFSPEDWLSIDETNINTNGNINLTGANILDYKDRTRAKVLLNNSHYKSTPIDTVRILAQQTNQQIESDVLFIYNTSKSFGNITINDMYTDAKYKANISTNNLDIQAFLPKANNSILNGNIAISGSQLTSDNRQFEGIINLYNSSIYNVKVDSALLHAQLFNQQINVDTLSITSNKTQANSTGSYHLNNGLFNANTNVVSQDLSFLSNFNVPEFTISNAYLETTISGRVDSIEYTAQMNVLDLEYSTLKADSIYGSSNGLYIPDSIKSDGHIDIFNLDAGGFNIHTTFFGFGFDTDLLKTQLSANTNESLSANINAEILLSDTIMVELESGNVSSQFTNFYLTDTTQRFYINDQTITVDNLDVREMTNKDFTLSANGQLSKLHKEDFQLNIEQFDLSRINQFLSSNDSIAGRLSSKMTIKGPLDSLEFNNHIEINQPRYNNTSLPNVNGQIFLKEDSLITNAWLPQLDSSVYANFSVPFKLSLNNEDDLEYSTPSTFASNLYIDSLTINTPDSNIYEYIKAGANANGIVGASGTFSQPQFSGYINFNNAFLNNAKQGMYYSNSLGRITFNGNTIGIDTLYIESDKGYFASSGDITFDTTIISGKVISSNMLTDINKFQIIQHRNHDINISGNPYYRPDEDNNPRFGGKITINKSSFYIPGIVDAGNNHSNSENIPLLVAATQTLDTIKTSSEQEIGDEQSELMKQIKGRLTIDIPRSTWLNSDDMNIEISGDFDIAKTTTYFEIFGDVEVVRGHYILYGRKFNITEGIITFMGGEEPDPRLDLKANYTYRGSDKEKHELVLSVTEYLSEPTIEFTLDDVVISQSDAVSIMIFGKTMDELSYDGQNGIIGSVGSNMLASMVSSSLNSTIGQRFKLDMIEVNSTENWHSAAFVIGKYITNDLFVIYQRGFGETEDDEITPETITLEYELNKILFIRLQSGSSKTSGFDVILKFEASK